MAGTGPSTGESRYPADFMREVEHQRFHNPATGKDVKFVSLNSPEQSKIYQQWRAKHRRTPAQQLAPGIAKNMGQADRSAMSHVVGRGSLDAEEMADRMGESKDDALHRLERLEQSGYVVGHETEEGHSYWLPSELGYEIVRQLRFQQTGKTSNMKNLDDWTFLATVDPRKRKFRNPETKQWVLFDSLPPAEQNRYKQQWQLQQSQPESQHAVIEGGPGELGEMGDAGMGGGEGGAMAMTDDQMLERGEDNTGEVEFGESQAMAEVEARLGDYLGIDLNDLLSPAGLGVVPVSLGTPDDPDDRHEGPDTALDGGEHVSCGDVRGGCVDEPPEMEGWSFLAEEEDKEAAMERQLLFPVQQPDVMGEPPPEPPPPAQVRRQLQDRMRDLGRGLMVAGAKSPRMQMMEIQSAMMGLMDQLELLADQPGREALRRRILLQLRPRVMRF